MVVGKCVVILPELKQNIILWICFYYKSIDNEWPQIYVYALWMVGYGSWISLLYCQFMIKYSVRYEISVYVVFPDADF